MDYARLEYLCGMELAALICREHGGERLPVQRLAALFAQRREVIRLHGQGVTAAQIAERLRLHVSSVRRIIRRNHAARAVHTPHHVQA